jgi:CheY-like chemotaxis protein
MPTTENTNAPAPLILVIDNDAIYRSVLLRWLDRAGYRVAEAADGREGLQHARQQQAALVVTDIFMPEFDGLELLPQLQQLAHLRGIIALSSHVAPQENFSYLDCARELGATAVFTKPVDKEVFLAAVAAALEG